MLRIEDIRAGTERVEKWESGGVGEWCSNKTIDIF
jgi:hypothetical protein